MSHEHLRVRVGGFGRAILPRASLFEIRLDPAANDVLIVLSGGSSTVASPATASPCDAFDVTSGPADERWLVQTSAFEFPLPRGFSVRSAAEPATPPGFDLVGPEGEVIYFLGPGAAARFSSAGALVGPSESAIASSENHLGLRVLVSYLHDGQKWWQARQVVPLPGGRVLLAVMQTAREPAVEAIERFTSIAATVKQPSHAA